MKIEKENSEEVLKLLKIRDFRQRIEKSKNDWSDSEIQSFKCW